MSERTDAAGALRNQNKFLKISLIYKLLQSPVNKADGRHRVDDLFILQHQIQVNRLRQNRVLRAKRNNTDFFYRIICHNGPLITGTVSE